MNRVKILYTAFLFSLLCITSVYAQESAEIPSDVNDVNQNFNELEEKYEISTWNYSSTLFAYADKDTVVIIDTKTSKILNKIQLDANILYVQFQNTNKAEQTKLFVVSEKGEVFFLNSKSGKILWIGDSYSESNLTAAAFNSTGDSIATGYEDGKVVIYQQQGDSNFFVPEEITSLEALDTIKINFLNFSQDKQFLLFGDDSGALIIWDLINKTERGRFYYNKEFCKSAFFTGEDDNILLLIDTLTAGIFDFEGNLIQKVQLEYSVKRMSISADGKTVMIVSNNNKRNYYNVNNKGTLEDITSSVAAANTAAKYPSLQSNDTALTDLPPLPNINDGEYQRVIIDEETGTVQIETLKPEGDSPVKPLVETPDREKNYDVIEVGAKFGIGPSPFTLNVNVSSGYITYRFLRPFYFGGKVDFGLGFPQGDFPYRYETPDGKLPNPKLFTMRAYGLAGLSLYPFEEDIEIFTDISLGYTGTFLWNISPSFNASSSLYSSLFTDIRVGAFYKGFKVWVDCTYEPIFRTCINLGAGYEFKLPEFKQKSKK